MRQFCVLVVMMIFVNYSAKAEIFDCTLSDPAMNLKYNTKTEELVIRKDLLGAPEISSNITFHILSSVMFVLRGSDGKQVAKLTLSNNGNDGSTTTLYPFDIEVNALAQQSNRGVGGCSSTLLKSVKP